MNADIPIEFICPISQTIMDDPVSLRCGHTFEKTHLTNWLNQSSMCPVCRFAYSSGDSLTTNFALKSLIQNYRESDSFQVASILPSINTKNKKNPDEEPVLEVLDDEEIGENKLKENIKGSIIEKNGIIKLSLNVIESKKKRANTFVCIIDISGSMGEIVGAAEGNKAFTRLDLVKHVLNVLISSLTEADYLSIISFSDQSKVELELMNMNKINKITARSCVKQLEPDSNTYTGPAIKLAYKTIKSAPKNHLKSIILLTDGIDTQGDDVLQTIFDRQEKPPGVQFNTFGFSNGIKSDTLQNLALKGRGTFGFIPDQTMIGTIFVNFLANTFQTFCQDIFIKLSNGYKFMSSKEENKITLQYGRTRNILIMKDFGCKEPLKVFLGTNPDAMFQLPVEEALPDLDFDYQLARYKLLELVLNPALPNVQIEMYEKSNEINKIKGFLEELRNIDEVNPNNEQIKLSLQYWNTWGAHYMRSFCFAHKLEQCMNFKAPSMKFYRSPQFDEIVGKLTDLFIGLPPPIPSGSIHASSTPIININMQRLMDYNNGCILSSCRVKLNTGEFKEMIDLKKDDVLDGGSRVVCLIKSKYSSQMVKLNDLVITPYHPIIYEGKWRFPIDILNENMRKGEDEVRNPNFCLIEGSKERTVCNLVLDSVHKAIIEGFECVTLGHGFTDETVRHPYYGSELVIEELKTFDGWDDGIIYLDHFKVQRDENGFVTGIRV